MIEISKDGYTKNTFGTKQCRTVCAAKSFMDFFRKLKNKNLYKGCAASLREYTSQTWNEKELEVCLADPDNIYYCPEHTDQGYIKEYYKV